MSKKLASMALCLACCGLSIQGMNTAHADIAPFRVALNPAGDLSEQLNDEQAIRKQSELFSKAYAKGDLTLQLSIYTQDATLSPPGKQFISGEEQIREFWASKAERKNVKHRLIPLDMKIVGNVAYDRGTYEQEFEANGSKVVESGNYLIVWRKGEDGAWRIVQDMWNRVANKTKAVAGDKGTSNAKGIVGETRIAERQVPVQIENQLEPAAEITVVETAAM